MESLVLFLPLVLVMVALMFFQSRRQRRATQATIDLHESLRPGDRVHTTSGLEASIVAIADDTVDLEIAPGVVTTWMKLAVRDRILPDDEQVDLDADEDAEDLAESDELGDSADSADGSRPIRGDT
jgi:preprotein translocase subunit YajC